MFDENRQVSHPPVDISIVVKKNMSSEEGKKINLPFILRL